MFEVLDRHGLSPNLMSATIAATSLVTYGGDVVPQRALAAIADGSARDIDLLVGTTLDETSLFGPDFAATAPRVADIAFGPTGRWSGASVLDEYVRSGSATAEQDARTPVLDRHDVPDPRHPARRGGAALHGAWPAFVRTGVAEHASLPRLAAVRRCAAGDDAASTTSAASSTRPRRPSAGSEAWSIEHPNLTDGHLGFIPSGKQNRQQQEAWQWHSYDGTPRVSSTRCRAR
jgi:hypothetical protein